MEEWKILKDTDRYEVSTEGRVRNTKTGKILNGTITEQGCVQVCLTINGKVRVRIVHRLVAETYFGDKCKGRNVYHRDGDKTNNRIDNLIIGTKSVASKSTCRNNNRTVNKQQRIRCVETGEEFESIEECSKESGLSRKTISRNINGETKRTKGGLHFELIG